MSTLAASTETTATTTAFDTDVAGITGPTSAAEAAETAVLTEGVESPNVPRAGERAPQPLDHRSANAFSIASFVLGLVSVVAGWSLFAPVTGLVLGVIALRRGTGERTLALWGVWLNGILLALGAIMLVIFVAFFGVALFAAAV